MEHDPDRRADGQHEIADAREKSRGVRGVVAIGVSQAFPVRRGRHDSKPDCAAGSFRVAIEDLYDLGGEAPVCAAQHLRVNFPFLAAMIDDKRASVRRTPATDLKAVMRAKATT